MASGARTDATPPRRRRLSEVSLEQTLAARAGASAARHCVSAVVLAPPSSAPSSVSSSASASPAGKVRTRTHAPALQGE